MKEKEPNSFHCASESPKSHVGLYDDLVQMEGLGPDSFQKFEK